MGIDDILILLGLICTPLMIFWRIRVKKISKYSIYLEDEYYYLVTMLNASNYEEKEKILKRAEESSLYKRIKYDKCGSIEYFRDIMK